MIVVRTTVDMFRLDFAIRAGLSFNGKPAGIAAIRERMLKQGWKTTSKSKRNMSTVVRTTITDKPGWIYVPGAKGFRYLSRQHARMS